MAPKQRSKHIKLTSHPGAGSAKPIPIHWGASDPHTRGPIIATLTTPEHRNVIGTHSGSYAVYRALAIAARVSALGDAVRGCATRNALCATSYAVTARPFDHRASRRR